MANKFSHLEDPKHPAQVRYSRNRTLCGKFVGIMSFHSGYTSPTWKEAPICPKCAALQVIAESARPILTATYDRDYCRVVVRFFAGDVITADTLGDVSEAELETITRAGGADVTGWQCALS